MHINMLVICLICSLLYIESSGKPVLSLPHVPPAESPSFVGYDCNTLTSEISRHALSPGVSCASTAPLPPSEVVQVQVITPRRYTHVKIKTCLITLSQLIVHCGMHSHSTIARGGFTINKIIQVTNVVCTMMHNSRKWITDLGMTISGLEVNSTRTIHITERGTQTTSSGECSGEDVALNGEIYRKAIIMSSYTITLREYMGTIDSDKGIIMLPYGTTFPFNLGQGFDATSGNCYWNIGEGDKECSPTSHSVLYQGAALILKPDGEGHTLVVNTTEYAFAVRLSKQTLICHQPVFSTEHPKLYVILSPASLWYFKRSAISPENVDIALYTSAKVAFLDHHVANQVTTLYHTLNTRLCALKERQLYQLISLAYTRPDDFAWAYMNAQGVTAILRGEVIYIMRCTPVPVTIRTSPSCYQEIPVTYNGTGMFLKPRSRIIVSYAEEIDCNPIAPAQFKHNDKWYQLTPVPVEVPPPLELAADGDPSNWVYTSATNIITAGLYSQEDLMHYQRRLMFPVEMQAISNTIAAAAGNQHTRLSHLYMSNLMDTNKIQEVVESLGTRIFGWMSSAAHWISGVGGMVYIFLAIKSLFNVIINGFLLYGKFGISVALLTVLSGTLAKHCLYGSIKGDRWIRKKKQVPNDEPADTLLLPEQCTPTIYTQQPTAPENHKSMYPSLQHPP